MTEMRHKRAGKAACLLLAAVLLLSGCRITHYSRTDAIRHMEEAHPGEKFTMGFFARQIEQEGERPLKVWETRFKDAPGLPFYVVSSSYYAGEFRDYSLDDTSSGVFGEYYAGQYDFGDVQVVFPAREAMLSFRYSLEFPYAGRAELERTIEVLEGLDAHFAAQRHPIERTYQFSFASPLNVVNDTPYTHSFANEMTPEACDEVLIEYARYVANTQINAEEFSKEELAAAVAYTDFLNSDDRFVFCLPSGETGYFEDLGLTGSNISFGVLYELLRRTGFPVNGTAMRFAFTGIDGNEYEFSYSFNDEIFLSGGKEMPGFYYLRNGERMPMPYFQCYYIDSSFCREITGILFQSVFPASLTWQEGIDKMLVEMAGEGDESV